MSKWTYEYKIGLISGKVKIESEKPPSEEELDLAIMDDIKCKNAYWIGFVEEE